jgi:hypothetical protein
MLGLEHFIGRGGKVEALHWSLSRRINKSKDMNDAWYEFTGILSEMHALSQSFSSSAM